MKKKQSLIYKILSVCLYALFAVSCSKTNVTPDNILTPNESSMSQEAMVAINTPLKLSKETYNGDFKQYTYNTNGQCIRIDMNQSYITYSYSRNTVIETTGYSDPTKAKIVRTYSLNALGLATKCTYTIGTKSYLWEYVYNNNKQVTKITHKSKIITKPTYSVDFTQLYTYNNDGNCTRYTYQLTFTNVMYDYDYDETHYNTTGNEYKGLDWLGKSSTHVRSVMVTITGFYYPDWNSHVDFTNYNWTYDAQGYNKQYTLSGATQGTATFIYR